MSPQALPTINVAAGAIVGPDGRVLIAQRPRGKHMAGAWEFPGGKVESGETTLDALARELREELGVEVGAGPHRPIRRINHAYRDFDVSIQVWRVHSFSGIPRGLDGQALRWCTLAELDSVGMLPADKPVIAALRLPEIIIESSTSDYSIGARQSAKMLGVTCDHPDAALAAEHSGADFVVMRRKMSESSLAQLSSALLVPCFCVGMSLHVAWRHGASGIHAIR